MAKMKGTDGTLQEVDANKAARTSLTHPFTRDADGGRYRLVTKSGLLTTIAARTTTAGHLWAMHNPSATKAVIIDRLAIAASMITDFTTEQRLILAARKVLGFTVLHTTGGSAPSADKWKKRESMALPSARFYFANAAAAITGSTISTPLDDPILEAVSGQPAAGTTVANIPIAAEFAGALDGGPYVLMQNEGIVISNEILMGAAGTMVLGVTCAWREVLIADALGM